MSNQVCLIIGASHAAAQLATSLRQEAWQGQITMIGDEAYLPYHRPPLSKTFLAGDKDIDDLLIRPASFYDKSAIQFKQGRVTHINRQQQQVTLEDGSQLHYDKLALCLGARVRTAGLTGEDLAGVHYLRNIADIQAIKPYVAQGKRAVIIGGGYIGLETAASLKKLGMEVVVLEVAERVLQRVTAPQMSAFYTRIHQQQGVEIYTQMAVSEIIGDSQVSAVKCTDGREFLADLVIIGIGVVPNVELAEQADLEVNNGIVVDEFGQTNDANIVAAGDCTNHFNAIYGRRMRLESVPNASDQAKSAAAAMCGIYKPYKSLPWFWSDQYDLKLQIAGLSQGYDQVVIRGDIQHGRSFAAFYLQQGKLIAADCINRPQEFMLSKKIIAENLSIDVARLVDESISVRELI